VLMQMAFELGEDLLRSRHDEVVEPAPLPVPKERVGDVTQMLADVLLDVAPVPRLGPAALLVPARDLVQHVPFLLDAAGLRQEDASLLPVDDDGTEGLVRVDQRLE